MTASVSRQSVQSAEAMEALGRRIAKSISTPFILFLTGTLGAGKTTLVRGLLRQLGQHGDVTSPTFTLVEPYLDLALPVYHFDFYRLEDGDELEPLGFWDFYHQQAVLLIEWPSRVEQALPEPDWDCQISIQETAREVMITPKTEKGVQALASFNQIVDEQTDN